MAKYPKHDNMPWKWLEEYKGKYFEGQWPSLVELFNIVSDKYPDNKCYECFNPEHILFTYSEAKKQMHNIACYLISKGVKKGDRVAVTGKNSPQWALAYMGILTMGAIVVPVDYTLTDAEIEHLIDFVEIKGLFVDGERFDRIGKDNKYGFKVSLEEKDHEDSYILNLKADEVSYENPKSSDLAAFLFTSGTTGTPKAVMLSHENFVTDDFAAQGLMNISSKDVFYAILPIHHAYTMLAVFIESMSVGANLIFGKRLVVSQIFKDLKQGQVTMFLAVPMLYNKLIISMMKAVDEKGKVASALIHFMMRISGFVKKVFHVNPGKKMFSFILKKVSLDTNRICIAGGGPLPSSTFRRFNQLGIDFVQGYGLTETSPILTLNPVFDYEEESIGKTLPFVDMKFINKDDDGNGEIIVKGPMVMKGYYNNQEATDEVIDKDGYLHTGDVGYMDERGFVYLTGRAKNIIVTEGGKNVFPEEIEDHFQLYNEVEQICVVGYIVDKEKKSEGICAIIYPNQTWLKTFEGSVQSHMEGICEEVNKELLPYKRIRKVYVADTQLEMTSTKKVKRFIVAKQYKDKIND